MTEKILYHYRVNRKQRAKIFINMSGMSLFYIAVIFALEPLFNITVETDIKFGLTAAFSVSTIVLLAIVIWLYRNPATYEATITETSFTVFYPYQTTWSFKVHIEDISHFEYRSSHSSNHSSAGIVLKDGQYLPISMNYGNSVNKMYAAVKTLKPELEFSQQKKSGFRF